MKIFPASLLGEGSGSPVLLECWALRQVPSLLSLLYGGHLEGAFLEKAKPLAHRWHPFWPGPALGLRALVILQEAVLGGVRNSSNHLASLPVWGAWAVGEAA